MILFYLIFGAMASAEKTDPGFCHQNFTNFRPNIGGRIEYRVSLDQAIEGKPVTGVSAWFAINTCACLMSFIMYFIFMQPAESEMVLEMSC